MNLVRRGELFYTDFGKTVGSEESGIRPAVIIQNDIGNYHSPTTIVSAITSQPKNNMPTHIFINNQSLPKDSVILTEHIRTIDKTRLLTYIGKLTEEEIKKLNRAIIISLGLNEEKINEQKNKPIF